MDLRDFALRYAAALLARITVEAAKYLAEQATRRKYRPKHLRREA